MTVYQPAGVWVASRLEDWNSNFTRPLTTFSSSYQACHIPPLLGVFVRKLPDWADNGLSVRSEPVTSLLEYMYILRFSASFVAIRLSAVQVYSHMLLYSLFTNTKSFDTGF
jgi:hypothetical protein